MAALIDSHLLVNSDGQPNLDENSADKPDRAPAKKHLKDDKETEHIDSQSNKNNKGKQPKKRPVKSRTDKSKESRKQLSNIANKTTAETKACTKATREIYQTFMAAFPGTNSKETAGNQVSLVEELQDSDAEEDTDGTAGEWSFSPITDTSDSLTSPNAGKKNIKSPTSNVMGKKKMFLPVLVNQWSCRRVSSNKCHLQFLFHPEFQLLLQPAAGKNSSPKTQSGSLTSRSGTSLSETAEAFVHEQSHNKYR